jgi:hypothetical protein
MLAEIRALGEGLIIADQSPEKLAADAMRNTNVQIAHQLRDSNDRNAVANAMIMSEDQRDYLGKLRTGRAAIFYTGLEKATFVDVDLFVPPSDLPVAQQANYPGFGMRAVSDAEVRKLMDPVVQHYRIELPLPGCELCQSPCLKRKGLLKAPRDPQSSAELSLGFNQLNRSAGIKDPAQGPAARRDAWKKIAQNCVDHAVSAGFAPDDLDGAWCSFVQAYPAFYPFGRPNAKQREEIKQISQPGGSP